MPQFKQGKLLGCEDLVYLVPYVASMSRSTKKYIEDTQSSFAGMFVERMDLGSNDMIGIFPLPSSVHTTTSSGSTFIKLSLQ